MTQLMFGMNKDVFCRCNFAQFIFITITYSFNSVVVLEKKIFFLLSEIFLNVDYYISKVAQTQ